MSSGNTKYGISVLFLYISLYAVSGQLLLTAPAKIQFFPQYSTVKLSWTFVGDADGFFGLGWHYATTESPTFKSFYKVDESGKPLGQTDPFFVNRVTFVGNVAAGDFSITIANLLTSDDVIYEIKCVYNIASGFYKNTTTVRPIVLSNITKFEVNSTEIDPGDTVALSCIVTKGSPSSKIQLIGKDGTQLEESVGSETQPSTITHVLRNVTRQSRGRYSCRVTTAGFTTPFGFLDLNVRYPPYWTNPIKMLYGCEGVVKNLPCSASADPLPTITRYDPDGEEIKSQRFMLKKYGIYRCKAVNDLGEILFNVSISKQTGKASKPVFNSCTYDSVSWNTGSNNAGAQFTLKYKEDGSDSDYKTLIESITDKSYSPSANSVNGFSSTKSYSFKVVAENCVSKMESEPCLVKGVVPTTEKRSSGNGGVIAGSVIAVLVVVVAIIIAVVFYMKKKKRDSASQSLTEKTPKDSNKPVPKPRHKPNDLLYGQELSSIGKPSTDPEERPGYSEIDTDEAGTGMNVPSWV